MRRLVLPAILVASSFFAGMVVTGRIGPADDATARQAAPATQSATSSAPAARSAVASTALPSFEDVADRVGRVWGLGSGTTKDPGPWEGEPRNMWKPTQHPGLWFHGGNLHQSRHNSLFLALQLKARMEGIPTPVYGLQEVHHLN